MTIKDSYDQDVKVADVVSFNLDGELKVGTVSNIIGKRAKIRYYIPNPFNEKWPAHTASTVLDEHQFKKLNDN